MHWFGAGLLSWNLLLACAAGTPAPQTAASRPTSQPATQPPKRVAFQPGVSIDWGRREVVVDARVTLRDGPIEFLACFVGKEHESLVRLTASGTHIYMALGLIGLTPGQPPTWDAATQTYLRPTGDLLELSFEWVQDGRLRTEDAFRWSREREYGRVPLSRPWVFAGSRRLDDHTLSCDRSGAGVPVVDFGDALVCLSGVRSDRSADLWLEANPDAVPPEGTAVKLVFRPARPRRYRVTIDFRGVAFVNGRYASLPDLAELLLLARRLEPKRIQPITLKGTLRSDEARIRADLARLGVPEGAVTFTRSKPPTSQPNPQSR